MPTGLLLKRGTQEGEVEGGGGGKAGEGAAAWVGWGRGVVTCELSNAGYCCWCLFSITLGCCLYSSCLPLGMLLTTTPYD